MTSCQRTLPSGKCVCPLLSSSSSGSSPPDVQADQDQLEQTATPPSDALLFTCCTLQDRAPKYLGHAMPCHAIKGTDILPAVSQPMSDRRHIRGGCPAQTLAHTSNKRFFTDLSTHTHPSPSIQVTTAHGRRRDNRPKTNVRLPCARPHHGHDMPPETVHAKGSWHFFFCHFLY